MRPRGSRCLRCRARTMRRARCCCQRPRHRAHALNRKNTGSAAGHPWRRRPSRRRLAPPSLTWRPRGRCSLHRRGRGTRPARKPGSRSLRCPSRHTAREGRQPWCPGAQGVGRQSPALHSWRSLGAGRVKNRRQGDRPRRHPRLPPAREIAEQGAAGRESLYELTNSASFSQRSGRECRGCPHRQAGEASHSGTGKTRGRLPLH